LQETSQAGGARAKPPPFLKELTILYGSSTPNRGTYLSVGGFGTPPTSPMRSSGHIGRSGGTSSKRASMDNMDDSQQPIGRYMKAISDSLIAKTYHERSRPQTQEPDYMAEAMELLARMVLKK